MKIFIKNMVCQGLKKYVLIELNNLNLKYKSFELGEIDFMERLSVPDIEKLDYSLHKYGLEVIFRRTRLVKSIHYAVMNLIRNEINLKSSFSKYISDKVGYDYRYLNECFKKETGTPIEEYYLEKRNENIDLKDLTWDRVLHFKN